MLHRIDLQNNVAQSNTIQYFRHVIAYPYLPYFTSPSKEEHERLGAAIIEGAAQQRSACHSLDILLIGVLRIRYTVISLF